MSGLTPFACELCGKRFGKAGKLESHLLGQHSARFAVSPRALSPAPPETARAVHDAVHIANNAFAATRITPAMAPAIVCQLCPPNLAKPFRNARDLAQHILSKHNDDHELEPAEANANTANEQVIDSQVSQYPLGGKRPPTVDDLQPANLRKRRKTNAAQAPHVASSINSHSTVKKELVAPPPALPVKHEPRPASGSPVSSAIVRTPLPAPAKMSPTAFTTPPHTAPSRNKVKGQSSRKAQRKDIAQSSPRHVTSNSTRESCKMAPSVAMSVTPSNKKPPPNPPHTPSDVNVNVNANALAHERSSKKSSRVSSDKAVNRSSPVAAKDETAITNRRVPESCVSGTTRPASGKTAGERQCGAR